MRLVTASQTIALDTQAKALLAAGHDVINLSVGELDFDPPTVVQQAVSQAVGNASNHYSPVAGLQASKQAVCAYEQAQHGVTYLPEQVLITNGAKQALYTTFLALVQPGDEVLVLQPAWVSYIEQIKLAGGVPVSVETTDQFSLDITAMERAMTDRTVGLILNYPNNPTGAVYTAALLQNVAQLAQEKKLWVISDEIYEHIIYGDVPFISFAKLYPHTVVVNGISKAAAVTGWRVGYAAGPVAIIQAMTALQSHLTGNVSNVMQAALPPALSNGLAADWLQQLQLRRQLVLDWVVQHPAVQLVSPQGAFYCFLDIRAFKMDSVTFCQRLLTDHHVALVPGSYFGRDGFVRLSFANSPDRIRVALERMDQFCAILSQ
ncbi:MAG: pyridoxal phosphate-dependent aminotransferase [Candidatus Kerfeldbacteria bacterium]|nr:pyridoxal phosphate-dependent aminotransferase [Candidatus Kerfeldbacteria bacterium]